jgi:hypothetical protein
VSLPKSLSPPIRPLTINKSLHLHSTLQRNYKYIVLNGYFNGRRANEPDFIFIEENLCNIHLPELFDVNRVNILEELNIPVNRTSQDIVKNQYGNRLLELCKCNAVKITIKNNIFIISL